MAFVVGVSRVRHPDARFIIDSMMNILSNIILKIYNDQYMIERLMWCHEEQRSVTRGDSIMPQPENDHQFTLIWPKTSGYLTVQAHSGGVSGCVVV